VTGAASQKPAKATQPAIARSEQMRLQRTRKIRIYQRQRSELVRRPNRVGAGAIDC
jgi:hypothetical protein